MNAPTLPSEISSIENLVLSSTEERALKLLGQNVEPAQVAAAVGVSESRISQLISNPYFAAKVYELRFQTLAKHSERDNAYDALEDDLIEKLKNMMPMMYKPMEVLAAVRVINQAKRRSQGSAGSAQTQAPVVALQIPLQVINQYRIDGNNQVIQAGQQTLITVQSGNMSKLLSQKKGTPQNEQLLPSPSASSA